jgi:hypothetical protein
MTLIHVTISWHAGQGQVQTEGDRESGNERFALLAILGLLQVRIV